MNLPLQVKWIRSVCAFAGSMKSVQFSPDPAALQSILLNEGVKAGGPVGATPRNSVRPSGRGTSIYTVCTHSIYFFYFIVAFSCTFFFFFLAFYIAFETQTQFHLLYYFLSQAQRVPVRKNHVEVTGGPVGKMQNRCSCYLMKPNASLSLCPFTLMWRGCFILSSSTQRDSAEEMDSTESPRHQASAHVCYGKYTCI